MTNKVLHEATEEEKRINDEESAYLEEQLSGIENVTIRPYYKPYSHQRVRRYLASEGIEMRTVMGYKYYRYKPCREYQLYDLETGEALYNGYHFTLKQLRMALASLDLPLKEEHPTRSTKRHEGCIRFQKAIERAKQGGQSNG